MLKFRKKYGRDNSSSFGRFGVSFLPHHKDGGFLRLLMKYYKSVHNMKDNGILYEVGETYQYIGNNPHQSLLWFVTTPWMSLGKRPYASKHHNLLRVEPVGNILDEYPFFRTDH